MCWKLWGCCAALQVFLWAVWEPEFLAGLGGQLSLACGFLGGLAILTDSPEEESVAERVNDKKEEVAEGEKPEEEKEVVGVTEVKEERKSILRKGPEAGGATPVRRKSEAAGSTDRDRTPPPSVRAGGQLQEAEEGSGLAGDFVVSF